MIRKGRRRRGGRGRLPTPVFIGKKPLADQYTPNTSVDRPYVELEPAEIEALRLVDLLGHSQEEAGEIMGVSRGTIWRFLQEARKKTAKALTEGRGIRITSDNEED
jgi:predicted DNA-binding protein (UPF0251 family)